MGHQYGQSRAAVLNDAGEFEEALAAANEALGREPDNSEHVWDRATALAALERYDEAVGELERAKALDTVTAVLDDDVLDDAYFSALLAAARAEEDVAAGCARLSRYRTVFPSWRHLGDAEDWQKRLRGELPSHFVKERFE